MTAATELNLGTGVSRQSLQSTKDVSRAIASLTASANDNLDSFTTKFRRTQAND